MVTCSWRCSWLVRNNDCQWWFVNLQGSRQCLQIWFFDLQVSQSQIWFAQTLMALCESGRALCVVRCNTNGGDAATVAAGSWWQRRRRVVAATVAGRETKERRDGDRRCNTERVRVRLRVVAAVGGGRRWSETLVVEVAAERGREERVADSRRGEVEGFVKLKP